MFIIDKNKNRVTKIQTENFQNSGIRERDHLQEWIANDPNFFDEELLIIQKEFDGFDDTRERIDLLALDKFGDVVVIENKLDDSGRDVLWQVLKYAAYCSGLSRNHIKDIYQRYLDKTSPGEDAEANIIEFLEANDFPEIELNKNQRIIMVSGNFRKEVTTTVLWLLNNSQLTIQCYKVTPYVWQDQMFLNVEQIIPIKEAEEYTIKIAEKHQENAGAKEELKSRHKTRIEFWQKFLNEANQSETNLYQNISPSKDNWLTGGIGMNGVVINVIVSKSFARCEVTISRPSKEENKSIFDELFRQKQQLESAFGGNLIWERLDNKKSCRIKHEKDGVSLYNKEDWDAMIRFMIDGAVRMEKAFKKPIGTINRKLKSGGLVT
jgi:hypothetical protein